MKIPNLREMLWFSPPDMGGENISSIMRRYIEYNGWRKGNNPAIIYCGSESQLENGMKAKLENPNVPFIMNFWGWLPERFIDIQWRNHYLAKIKIIEEYVDIITVPSEIALEQLLMCGVTKKIEIYPPGVDTIKLLLAKNGSRKYLKTLPFVLSIGRHVPHKSFQSVIEALKETSIQYIIIGNGEYKEKLLEFAKERNVLLEIVEDANDGDKGEMISLAKVVVVPSRYEGFGLPIVEAATISTPVLASPLPVFKYLFGENVEYFEDIADLKSKIEKIINDESYRRKVIFKEAILGLRYSAINQSIHLNDLFVETIANHLKAEMKKECAKGINTLADAYNLDALIDAEYFKYRLNPGTTLFHFRVIPLLQNLTGKTVLDVGSSTGIFALFMAKEGYDVTCIDIAEEYLKLVVALAEKNGVSQKVKTKICDATNLETEFQENSFDNVWAGEIIEHFEDSKLLIRQLMRVLKPSGRFLLTVPYQNACEDPFHLKTFETEEDIKKIFQEFPNFEVKEVKKIGSPGGNYNNWFAWGIKNI